MSGGLAAAWAVAVAPGVAGCLTALGLLLLFRAVLLGAVVLLHVRSMRLGLHAFVIGRNGMRAGGTYRRRTLWPRVAIIASYFSDYKLCFIPTGRASKAEQKVRSGGADRVMVVERVMERERQGRVVCCAFLLVRVASVVPANYCNRQAGS